MVVLRKPGKTIKQQRTPGGWHPPDHPGQPAGTLVARPQLSRSTVGARAWFPGALQTAVRHRTQQPPITHRQALVGILFVLKTGIPWEDLPAEMNCGCGMSCWRRLRDWQIDGTWDKLHATLLERLDSAGRIDWDRAAIDSSSVRVNGCSSRRRAMARAIRRLSRSSP